MKEDSPKHREDGTLWKAITKLFKRDREIKVLLLLEGFPDGASGKEPASQCLDNVRILILLCVFFFFSFFFFFTTETT